jgi:hypothetical protein
METEQKINKLHAAIKSLDTIIENHNCTIGDGEGGICGKKAVAVLIVKGPKPLEQYFCENHLKIGCINVKANTFPDRKYLFYISPIKNGLNTYPLTFPIGLKATTFFETPAMCIVSTTSEISL